MEHAFDVRDYDQIGTIIFYTTLKSLDVMVTIKEHNFIDSPLIATELTQFLALNTDFEVTQELSEKMKAMETANKQFSKDVQEAIKAANAAANKYDNSFKSKLEKVENRLKTLESKAS